MTSNTVTVLKRDAYGAITLWIETDNRGNRILRNESNSSTRLTPAQETQWKKNFQ